MLANHPFVTDVDFELEQMMKEGITPLWQDTQENTDGGDTPQIDDNMTSGGYENTGDNNTD